MTASVHVVGDGCDSASEVGGAEAGSTVSAQKLRANRENALRSTGPRGAAGKQNSAKNSLKHGGYAAAAVAIPRGRFAEDPDALRVFIEGIVVSLDPRDALEREQARRIAIAYVRARRLSIYEAESVGRPEHTGIDGDLGDGSGLERELAQARRFRNWFLSGQDVGVDFESVLQQMLALWRLGEGREEFEPEPDENTSLSAQERVEWFVAHYPTRLGFVEDLLAKADKVRRQIRARDAARSAGARTALEDTEKISVTSQRNSRELGQALREYERLRSRELQALAASPTRNEPTDGPNT